MAVGRSKVARSAGQGDRSCWFHKVSYRSRMWMASHRRWHGQLSEEDDTNATNSTRSQYHNTWSFAGIAGGKFDCSLRPKQSSSSVSSSIESYSALDDEGLFSHEEYPKNDNASTTNDDEQLSCNIPY
eukprot:scaffold9159_cov67-Skeletonema_marinoi.AAC.1